MHDQPLPPSSQAGQRPPPSPGRPAPRRFLISATQADGTCSHWSRTGGCSMDHILEAMDTAGLGGVVRVQPLRDVLEAA